MKRKLFSCMLRFIDKIEEKMIKFAEKSMSDHYIRGDWSEVQRWYRFWKDAKRDRYVIQELMKKIEES